MLDIKKAAKFQSSLSLRLILNSDLDEVQTIGGADSSYERGKGLIGATVSVFKFQDSEPIDMATEIQKVKIPYMPGFLGFREGPAIIKAYGKLKIKPDVTFIDGNGIAHPRRMGLASYVGILLDIPTIGCAKSSYFPYQPPLNERGSFTSYCNNKGEKVGYCLRTRCSVKPVFVSPGHRMDCDSARDLVLDCSKYRIPEPLRMAHHLTRNIFSKGPLSF
jgi:deoxyribonuclease V